MSAGHGAGARAMRVARRHARNALVTGNVAGLAALAPARRLARTPKAPINAVSPIWSGYPPLVHAARPSARNAVIGLLLHQGAAVFWAALFEPLFGRAAEKSTAAAVVGGAAVAAAAYVTDYHIVPARFRPGFEASMSSRSLFFVCAAPAAGFAAPARLRGLRHHEIENRDERDESGHAERGPDAVVPPVAVR